MVALYKTEFYSHSCIDSLFPKLSASFHSGLAYSNKSYECFYQSICYATLACVTDHQCDVKLLTLTLTAHVHFAYDAKLWKANRPSDNYLCWPVSPTITLSCVPEPQKLTAAKIRIKANYESCGGEGEERGTEKLSPPKNGAVETLAYEAL